MTYQIILEPGGERFSAGADQPLLDAALQAGLPLPYGCRGGSCGACRCRLLHGRVDYPEPPEALTAAERAAGQILLCQARAAADLTLQADSDGLTVKTVPARVTELIRLAPDVMELKLQLPPSETLDYRAGQYVDVILRNGKRRSFSLAGPPRQEQPLELHVRRVPGGEFSESVFNGLQPRAILRLQGPLGAFYLRDVGQPDPPPAILIAGGTGFAPVKAMLEDLFLRGQERSLHLYWGARDRVDLYRHELALEWAEKYPYFRYTPVLSEPAAGGDWSGRRGWVHAAAAADYPELSDYQVYMSGPPAMIAAGKEAFFAQGLDPGRLYYDAFDYAVS